MVELIFRQNIAMSDDVHVVKNNTTGATGEA
jgi:hypothetical protein